MKGKSIPMDQKNTFDVLKYTTVTVVVVVIVADVVEDIGRRSWPSPRVNWVGLAPPTRTHTHMHITYA